MICRTESIADIFHVDVLFSFSFYDCETSILQDSN